MGAIATPVRLRGSVIPVDADVSVGSEAGTVHGGRSFGLQGDAPWIVRGILGVTGACIAVFVWVFVHGHHPWTLALIPALTTAVFVGSALAAWGRTRGGRATLEVTPVRVEVQEEGRRTLLLDRAVPWSALLLVAPGHRRRMLVVGQRTETFVVMEPGAVPGDDRGTGPGWVDRTVHADLDALAMSPASAGVLTLSAGHSLTGLLAVLESDVEGSTPWMQHQVPGGETLRVTRGELSLGTRKVSLSGDRRVAAYALETGRGSPVAGLGIANGEYAETMVLVACDEAGVAPGAAASDVTPDVYIPLHVFEVLRTVVG